MISQYLKVSHPLLIDLYVGFLIESSMIDYWSNQSINRSQNVSFDYIRRILDWWYDRSKLLQLIDQITVVDWFGNMAWINHKSRFPILFRIARRKYWNIPATSVPIEWLFNDAGNQITNDWNHLKPESVNELLFIKKNINKKLQ